MKDGRCAPAYSAGRGGKEGWGEEAQVSRSEVTPPSLAFHSPTPPPWLASWFLQSDNKGAATRSAEGGKGGHCRDSVVGP